MRWNGDVRVGGRQRESDRVGNEGEKHKEIETEEQSINKTVASLLRARVINPRGRGRN